MIYTFYSYKGGVGRSMALANVAELFYRAGLKVLMVDWDLEAPGLEKFFPIDHKEFYDRKGVIDLLLDYKELMAHYVKFNEDDDLDSLPFDRPEQFFFDIYPDNQRSAGKLLLLSAGKREENKFSEYASRVKNFDWKNFYEVWAGDAYIEWLRCQFERVADVILIDSRTGISEIGVCTYQFADVIIMFTSANQQSLEGTLNMLSAFKRREVAEVRKSFQRPLETIVVPARVEMTESNYLDEFQQRFIRLFSEHIPQQLGSKPDRLWRLYIPYTPKYFYEEKLAIPEKDKAHAQQLVEAFTKLTATLSILTKPDSIVRKKVLETKTHSGGRSVSRIQINPDIFILEDNVYIETIPRLKDWGTAPDRREFFGRVQELNQLENWIIRDRCRLVAILGIGGIGKTDFALELGRRVEDKFDYVIWRSLREAPIIEDLLADIINYLSDCEVIANDTLDRQLSQLLNYLRLNRCLVILDNAESILKGQGTAGDYRNGYTGYGKLFSLFAETSCQSCLLLTSRETPQEIDNLAGTDRVVRSLSLPGLNVNEAKELLLSKFALTGENEDWEKLLDLYRGNPLALDLAERQIHEVFSDNIADFLVEGTHVFEGMKELLNWHFDRLSVAEREILYWLAIEREPTSVKGLRDNLLKGSKSVPTNIQSLQRHIPLELRNKAFTLQPVILEYTTAKFISAVCQEIIAGEIDLFNRHALMQATAKDYVRNNQTKLILKPIIDRLLTHFETDRALLWQIKKILVKIRDNAVWRSGYGAGNILNLALAQKLDLEGYDFSTLDIRQAYLQSAILLHVNFTAANFFQSSFTETFSSLLSVAFSPPNGQYLATGDADGGIRLWRVQDLAQCEHIKAHDSWVRSIAFNHNGTLLASGSDDQKIKLWTVDLDQGTLSEHSKYPVLEGHTYRVRSVAFHPQNKDLLASCSYDHTIRLWDLRTGKHRVLEGHSDWVRTIAFSRDGHKVVSSTDKTLRIWNVVTGICEDTFEINTQSQSVAFSFDGKILAAGCDDNTIKLWDFNTNKISKLPSLKGHHDYVRSVAFNKEGIMASGSYDNTIKLWDLKTGTCIKNLTGHTHRLTAIAFSPDGKTLVSGGWDRTLKLWNIPEGNESLRTLQSRTDWICGVDISPDGKFVVSGSDDQVVKLWDVKNGLVERLEGHKTWVWAVAFSPDGKTIASGSFDHTIGLWNTKDRKLIHKIDGHKNWIWAVVFSPDGKLLASSGEDRTVKIWQVKTGSLFANIDIIDSQWVRSVAFSPDSRFIATGSDDGKVRIWKINKNQNCLLSHTLAGHRDRVRSVAFAPDGKTLASGSYDKTVKIWDLDTGECLRTLWGHSHQVRSVAFSRDGKVLASGGNDRTVRLWHPDTGECFNILAGDKGHTDEVRAVAFSREEDILISSSKDGTIRLWQANTGEFIKLLREPRPYEGMKITGAKGLSDVQKASLKALGSVGN
jgi:WD40 repeat protein/MinD-like ATPase involved in chromosome partitioning or flagellar assembly